jgi:hypothetical protein
MHECLIWLESFESNSGEVEVPYLGLGSVSAIIHILARSPLAIKTSLLCAVIVVLCR